MISTLRKIVNNSILLTHLNYAKGQIKPHLGLGHGSGATHGRTDLAGSVKYLHSVVDDYLQYANVDEDFLRGKRILEIGPGDNLGVGALFIAKGAQSFCAYDRFFPKSDETRNKRIYRQLFEHLNKEEQDRLGNTVFMEGDDEARLGGKQLRAEYGFPIEQLLERVAEEKFDIILSRAVLEHVYDLKSSWKNMVSLLKPDGQMWHKVDFRNHGFYDQFHPLHFLTISPNLWKKVSQPDPTLNRQRINVYRDYAEKHFGKSQFFVTHVLQGKDIDPHPQNLQVGIHYGDDEKQLLDKIRPKLLPEFSCLSDEELLTSGIFLICQEPIS